MLEEIHGGRREEYEAGLVGFLVEAHKECLDVDPEDMEWVGIVRTEAGPGSRLVDRSLAIVDLDSEVTE